MADISAKAVMELRAKSGVSMMACKKALVEANGDAEAAMEILRKKGAAKAADKADRATSEGTIAVAERAVVALNCETDFVAKNEAFVQFAQHLAEVANEKGTEAAEQLFESEKTEMITKLGENITLGQIATVEVGDTIGAYIHSNNKLAGVVALNGGNEEVARDIAMHAVASNPSVLSPDEIEDEIVAKEREIWTVQLQNEGKPEQIIEKILLGKEKKFREESALLKQSFVKNPEVSVEAFAKENGAEVVAFLRLAV